MDDNYSKNSIENVLLIVFYKYTAVTILIILFIVFIQSFTNRKIPMILVNLYKD